MIRNPLSLAVIAGMTRNPLKNRLFRYLLYLGLIIILIFFSVRLYTIKKDSADGRLLIAKVSIEMVKESPLFGTGISGFKTEYPNHQADYFKTHPDSPYLALADDVDTPFNEFLKILIEQGIVGFFLFLCVLHCVMNGKNTILQSAILSLLIFALFSYPFDKLPFVMLFVFFIASLSKSNNPVFTLRLKKKSYSIILVLIIFPMIALTANNAFNYSKSCQAWNKALKLFSEDKVQSLKTLKNLQTDLNNNPIFLTTYGKALNMSENYVEAASVLEEAVKRQPLSLTYIELGKCYEKLNFPEKALLCWRKAIFMVPSRFTPLYLTMKLHYKNKEFDKAKEYAEQLINKKIKIENPEIDNMKREARFMLDYYQLPE